MTIVETRPISKTKSFELQTIVEKSRGTIEIKEEAAEEETA